MYLKSISASKDIIGDLTPPSATKNKVTGGPYEERERPNAARKVGLDILCSRTDQR